MSIYLPGTGFATQGPCTDGYHVPLKDEWEGVLNIMTGLGFTSLSDYVSKLHLPNASFRISSSGDVSALTYGMYWTCNTGTSDGYGYSLQMRESYNTNIVGTTVKTAGESIRPFYNSYVEPDNTWTVIHGKLGGAGIFWNTTDGLISITNGTTGYTISDKNLGATTVFNSGDTKSESNCGKFYQWGNNYGFPFTGSVTTSSTQIDASSYGPGNYYSSSTFILYANSKPDWSSVTNNNLRGGEDGNVKVVNELKNVYIGEYLIDDGIYHNTSLGLITLAYQGNLLTIADKDLGSSTLNGYGYMYQWGNNYGWTSKSAGSYSSGITTSAINASTYGPGNYYNSSTLRMVHNPNGGDSGQTAGYNYWDSSLNKNLWGQITDTYEARRGPCAEGYHIPSRQDILNLRTYYQGIVPSESRNAKTHLYMGGGGRYIGGYSYNGNTITAYTISEDSYARYWTSDNQTSSSTGEIIDTRWLFSLTSGSPSTASFDTGQINLIAIRPYKNTPVLPDSTWTVIYKPN